MLHFKALFIQIQTEDNITRFDEYCYGKYDERKTVFYFSVMFSLLLGLQILFEIFIFPDECKVNKTILKNMLLLQIRICERLFPPIREKFKRYVRKAYITVYEIENICSYLFGYNNKANDS